MPGTKRKMSMHIRRQRQERGRQIRLIQVRTGIRSLKYCDILCRIGDRTGTRPLEYYNIWCISVRDRTVVARSDSSRSGQVEDH